MKKPSIRQIKAMQNLSQGMSKRQSLIKAGYSVSSANEASRVLTSKSMLNLVESFKGELVKAGLTQKYMAGKVKEWMEVPLTSQGQVVKDENGQPIPNVASQAIGFDRWADIMDYKGEQKTNGTKRKLTIEEFVFGKNSDSSGV